MAKESIFKPEIDEKGWYGLSLPYDADFQADLKAIPGYARRWDKAAKKWWISPLWWPCAADFILSHFGVDLTPERGPYPMPNLPLKPIEPVKEVAIQAAWVGGQ